MFIDKGETIPDFLSPESSRIFSFETDTNETIYINMS